jgi:hypothetical protein
LLTNFRINVHRTTIKKWENKGMFVVNNNNNNNNNSYI